jgi:hypothetical protein
LFSVSKPNTCHRPSDQTLHFKFQMVGCTLPVCSCLFTILNNKAAFEPETQFLNQTWKYFEELFVFWNNIILILLQSRSKFRRITDRRTNVPFLLLILKVKS